MNKKVIDLKGKDVKKAIPKGLSYFFVDFGVTPGFAHIIEDEQRFPPVFAQVLNLNKASKELIMTSEALFSRKFWEEF